LIFKLDDEAVKKYEECNPMTNQPPAQATPEFWRRCSSCKNTIGYQTKYFNCSVSTCTRKRVGYVFCTVHCWERHLPGARHRDAAAVEAKSPTFQDWSRELESDSGGAIPAVATSELQRQPNRVIIRDAPGVSKAQFPNKPAIHSKNDPLENEILVVVSKLKNYIRERSEMNTSESVMSVLSNRLRRLCDKAVESAKADGRKTVMDRDFE
jgi:hypothetical protein